MTYVSGARVLIVGGTSGIGQAVGQAVVERGGTPILVSRRRASVDAALAAVPGSEGRVCDLADPDQVAALVETGPIDHLVFTAGEPLSLVPLDRLERATAEQFFATRVHGALAVVRRVAPVIRAGGSVTLTTGTASDRPGPGWVVAAAVCGAINAMTRALAVELAPLRVNAVSPGVVRSPLWSEIPEREREDFYESVRRSLPLQRVGEVADVALSYLYAMEQQHGTGAIIRVDGGTVLV